MKLWKELGLLIQSQVSSFLERNYNPNLSFYKEGFMSLESKTVLSNRWGMKVGEIIGIHTRPDHISREGWQSWSIQELEKIDCKPKCKKWSASNFCTDSSNYKVTECLYGQATIDNALCITGKLFSTFLVRSTFTCSSKFLFRCCSELNSILLESMSTRSEFGLSW